MIDELLQSVTKLLTPKEVKKLHRTIANSNIRSEANLKEYFSREGRRVAEQLAAARSKSGNSIFDLYHIVSGHRDILGFLSRHLDTLPQQFRISVKNIEKKVLTVFEAINLYKSIQKQVLILGILPRRLIDKIININNIEKKVDQTSRLIQLFLIRIVEEKAKQKNVGIVKKNSARSSSRPIDSKFLEETKQSIESRMENLSENATAVIANILECLSSEASKGNPDLEALKKDVSLKLARLKKQNLSLYRQEIKSIRRLLHPDGFRGSQETRSVANELSALFNGVMTK